MRRTELLAVLTAAALLGGCQRDEPVTVGASEAPPVRLSVIEVEPQPFTATVAITGTLVSRSQVEVKAETVGRILKFPKEEGDRVDAGEAVAWVDDEDERLALRQAESAVEVARAALERARVVEDHNRSEAARARNLLASGGITDRDLRAAELAERDARAQVALAEAQLEQAQAALQVAEKRVRDTVIRVPVAGEIQRKHVNTGAYVDPPTTILTLVDNTRLELESPIASAELAPIRRGQHVTFRTGGYPETVFEGHVIEVSPAVDPQSRSAKVRIRAKNPERKLRAGMFAEGVILTAVREEAIVVPAAAVHRDDQGLRDSFVYVVEHGKAVRRPVTVGREHDASLEIVSGLGPGDLLIARRSIELAEGVRVEPR